MCDFLHAGADRLCSRTIGCGRQSPEHERMASCWRIGFEAVITLTLTVVAYNELERASRVHQSAVWKYATCWSSVTCRQSECQHIIWQADCYRLVSPQR